MTYKSKGALAYNLFIFLLKESIAISFFHNSSFLFVLFFLFRAIPIAYGSSQARGQIGAAAAGLHYSHSNTGSKPCLQPMPQLVAMLDP